MSDIVVEIEKTTLRKLVLATLTGFVPMSIRDIPKLEEKLAAITDMQRKNLLSTMDTHEMHRIYRGPYGKVFLENSNAALRRLAEESNTLRQPSYGQTSGVFLTFDERHVLSVPPPLEK